VEANQIGHLTNNGTVWIKKNFGLTLTSTYYFGYGYSGSEFTIDNWGSWESLEMTFYFQEINHYNHYGGSYTSTFNDPTSIEDVDATIQFRDCEFVAQPGSEEDTWFNGPVYFYSSYSINYYGYSSTPSYKIIVNTTNFALSNCSFAGVNIIFNFPGWIQDSNFTYYSVINTTTSGITVWLAGKIFWKNSYNFISGIDGSLMVITEEDAEIIHDGYVILLPYSWIWNNGTWIVGDTAYFYIDQSYGFLNLGYCDITSSLYFYGSEFTSAKTGDEVGDVINRGTIQITNGGNVYWYTDAGTFYQCDDGVIKLIYDVSTTGQSSGYSYFSRIYLDGKIGVTITSDYYDADISYISLFQYDEAQYSAEIISPGVFIGDGTEYTVDEDGGSYLLYPQLVCVDPTIGYVYLYPLFEGTCSSHYSKYTNLFNPAPVGGVCDKLDDSIKNAEARCNIGGEECGFPGTPGGGGGDSSATSLHFSLAILVSLMAYLYYQC